MDITRRDELIAELYGAHCSLQDISTYLGIAYGTAFNVIERSTIEKRRKGRPNRAEMPTRQRPVDYFGPSYVPECFTTEDEVSAFASRWPAINHPRTKPKDRSARLPAPVIRERYKKVKATPHGRMEIKLEGEDGPPEQPPPENVPLTDPVSSESPADEIAARLASIEGSSPPASSSATDSEPELESAP